MKPPYTYPHERGLRPSRGAFDTAAPNDERARRRRSARQSRDSNESDEIRVNPNSVWPLPLSTGARGGHGRFAHQGHVQYRQQLPQPEIYNTQVVDDDVDDGDDKEESDYAAGDVVAEVEAPKARGRWGRIVDRFGAKLGRNNGKSKDVGLNGNGKQDRESGLKRIYKKLGCFGRGNGQNKGGQQQEPPQRQQDDEIPPEVGGPGVLPLDANIPPEVVQQLLAANQAPEPVAGPSTMVQRVSTLMAETRPAPDLPPHPAAAQSLEQQYQQQQASDSAMNQKPLDSYLAAKALHMMTEPHSGFRSQSAFSLAPVQETELNTCSSQNSLATTTLGPDAIAYQVGQQQHNALSPPPGRHYMSGALQQQAYSPGLHPLLGGGGSSEGFDNPFAHLNAEIDGPARPSRHPIADAHAEEWHRCGPAIPERLSSRPWRPRSRAMLSSSSSMSHRRRQRSIMSGSSSLDSRRMSWNPYDLPTPPRQPLLADMMELLKQQQSSSRPSTARGPRASRSSNLMTNAGSALVNVNAAAAAANANANGNGSSNARKSSFSNVKNSNNAAIAVVPGHVRGVPLFSTGSSAAGDSAVSGVSQGSAEEAPWADGMARLSRTTEDSGVGVLAEEEQQHKNKTKQQNQYQQQLEKNQQQQQYQPPQQQHQKPPQQHRKKNSDATTTMAMWRARDRNSKAAAAVAKAEKQQQQSLHENGDGSSSTSSATAAAAGGGPAGPPAGGGGGLGIMNEAWWKRNSNGKMVPPPLSLPLVKQPAPAPTLAPASQSRLQLPQKQPLPSQQLPLPPLPKTQQQQQQKRGMRTSI
ncbi:hypothetical protein B0T24DRAFT_606233 [Lasiosphaeria ovina]|uniref:Uncharacterized protein n=1 Tax=Lasiosphaeria ovina TaxID=92902 RepID=A0AAE0NLL7_9PEZI|nr:hypothetical protein B0T24DRAFT_606233 [Lasiosphaeria ovina]